MSAPPKKQALVVLHHLFKEMKARNITSMPIDVIEEVLVKYKVIDK
jgi:hypothetical protein